MNYSKATNSTELVEMSSSTKEYIEVKICVTDNCQVQLVQSTLIMAWYLHVYCFDDGTSWYGTGSGVYSGSLCNGKISY